MFVESPAYTDGSTMPARFATINVAGGRGASVPLAWGDEPAGTKSFLLEMIDHHPVARGWVHWLVADIPGTVHGLDEGASGTSAMPSSALELPNTGGRIGYGGMQPPVGSGVHDYEIAVLALDVDELGVNRGASLDEVRAFAEGHVLASARIVGRFGR
jgi:Raf kinase inhibitor-like YbhB/YbcL family protein